MEYSGSGMEEDNVTLSFSCAVSALQAVNDSILPDSIAITARVFHILYGSFQVGLGVLLNILILILVSKFKKLRNMSSRIAVQLAIADLALTITTGMPTIPNNIAGRWILGVDLCVTSGLVIFMMTIYRTLLIFIFSFDRFSSVFVPFSYPKYSSRITVMMCVTALSISVVTSLLGIPPVLDCYIFSEPILSCVVSPRCSKKCSYFFYTFMSTVLLPSVIMPIGLFLSLYIKGRKIRWKESRMLGQAKKRNITDQEWRIMKTFFLLFLALFFVTFLPFILFSTAPQLGSIARILVVQLGNDIVTLLVITDPIIIMRNKDFKEALNNLMKPFTHAYCTSLKKKQKLTESDTTETNENLEVAKEDNLNNPSA